jgi:selenophosphate synthetase-related protein
MGRPSALQELREALRGSSVYRNKQHIAPVSSLFAGFAESFGIKNGDDAAAIPHGDGFLLLAAEGIAETLVRHNPRLAGRCAVQANINDIYAMGGHPLAVVNVLGTPDDGTAAELCRGMQENALRYNVPVVGGHVLRTEREAGVAVAVLGRARRCITSFDAKPGDRLLFVRRRNGVWLGDMGFWNGTLPEDDGDLLPHLGLLPQCAEQGLVLAGKDVSMAGISGTALMLAESSRVGVSLGIDRIVPPAGVPLTAWLLAFLSYGFLLAVHPARQAETMDLFLKAGLYAAEIGAFHPERRAWLHQGTCSRVLWDFEKEPFAGGGA